MTPTSSRRRSAFGLAAPPIAVLAIALAFVPIRWVPTSGVLAGVVALGLAIVALVRRERLLAPLVTIAVLGVAVDLTGVGLLVVGARQVAITSRPSAEAADAAAPTGEYHFTEAVGFLPRGRRVVLRVESTTTEFVVLSRSKTDGVGTSVTTTESQPYFVSDRLDRRGIGRDELTIAARPLDPVDSTRIRCSIEVDGKVVVEQAARGRRAAVVCTAQD